jgi:hypothetical protein
MPQYHYERFRVSRYPAIRYGITCCEQHSRLALAKIFPLYLEFLLVWMPDLLGHKSSRSLTIIVGPPEGHGLVAKFADKRRTLAANN